MSQIPGARTYKNKIQDKKYVQCGMNMNDENV